MLRSRSLVAAVALFLSASALAVPASLTHQGRLLDSSGTALTGAHSITFSLYESASGGSAVWDDTLSLELDEGYFSTVLDISDDSIFDSDTLYLGVAVDGGTELSRLPFTSVGYAFRAQNATSAITATNLSGGSIDATEIKVDGTTIVGSDGRIQAEVGWDNLTNVPSGVSAFSDLGCSTDQIIVYDGSAWQCTTLSDLTIATSQLDGSIGIGNLPVGTGSSDVAAGDASYSKNETYTRDEVDAMIAAAGPGVAETLSERLASRAHRQDSFTWDRNWQPVAGSFITFESAGGPVGIGGSNTFTENSGDNDSTELGCRNMIDGQPAAFYGGASDPAYFWTEGLERADDGWGIWNPFVIYDGIPEGQHTFHRECHDEDTDRDSYIGRGGSITNFVIEPYGPPSSSDVKAYHKSVAGRQSVGTAYSSVNNLNTQITASGGPVRISISVPMSGGSHSSCRPLIDGVPAGQAEGDNTGSAYQEGLLYTVDGWAMFNRTRVYNNVSAGSHNVTVECRTDSGTVNLSNTRGQMDLSIVTYPDPSDSNTKVRAYGTSKLGQQNHTGANKWEAYSGLSLDVEVKSGTKLEVGYSIPLYSGSTATCRPTLDGGHEWPGQPDNYGDKWSEGLQRTDGWMLWDKMRVYEGISPGTHTIGVECLNDSTSSTPRMGRNDGAQALWAVAYDK